MYKNIIMMNNLEMNFMNKINNKIKNMYQNKCKIILRIIMRIFQNNLKVLNNYNRILLLIIKFNKRNLSSMKNHIVKQLENLP